MTHTSFPKSIVIRITILVLLLCVIVGIKVYATRDMNAILRDIRAHYTQVATIRTTRAASVSVTYGNPEATTFLLPPRENSTSSEQVYSIATSISIEGDARALEQFLTELEALPYYFTLLDVLYTIHEI